MGRLAAIWGIAGVVLILGSAVYRLSFPALETFGYPLGGLHWLAIALSITFMSYSEGYRGFQQAFSPRVVARAIYLRDHPRPFHVLLAPFFCMGFFHTTRRRKVVSFSLTAGIILLIVGVRQLSQPWRGIVDIGVVIGLTWGMACILYFAAVAFGGGFSQDREFDCSPEVPEDV